MLFLKNLFWYMLVLLLWPIPISSHAQNADSLKNEVAACGSKDTAKVSLLLSLAAQVNPSNIDSALGYAQQGLLAAETLQYAVGKARCLACIGNIYMHHNRPAEAANNFRAAMAAYKAIGMLHDRTSCALSLADALYRESKYDSAMQLYNDALKESSSAKDAANEGAALTAIGGLHADFNNYREALKNYLEALTVYERTKDTAGISSSYSNIATIYSSIGEYKKAIEYLNKELGLEQGKSNSEGVLFSLVNEGIVYGEMKDFANSIKYFEKARSLADSLGNINWKLGCMNNLAEAYMFDNDKVKARQLYESVLAQAEKINDVIIKVPAEAGLGRILIDDGKIREGITHLGHAFKLAMNSGLKESIVNTSLDLSAAYERINEPGLSLKFYKTYTDYKDSLSAKKHDRQIQQMQYEFDLSKKDAQISLLEKTKLLETARSEKQMQLIWALALSLLLLTVISLQMLRNHRIQERNLQLINQQKEEIEKQAIGLQHLNEYKDKTFSILSHDLRGPIGSLITMMDLIGDGSAPIERLVALKPSIDEHVRSVYNLIENLLLWSGSHLTGDTNSRPEKVDIHNLIVTNIQLAQSNATKKEITLVNKVLSGTIAMFDPDQFDFIIRNLLANAIKFTPPKGTITVSSEMQHEVVMLFVKDTGIGMEKDQLDNLFIATENRSTPGTQGEKGVGLGLLLCAEFAQANKGEITAESVVGAGTTFTLTLPSA